MVASKPKIWVTYTNTRVHIASVSPNDPEWPTYKASIVDATPSLTATLIHGQLIRAGCDSELIPLAIDEQASPRREGFRVT